MCNTQTLTYSTYTYIQYTAEEAELPLKRCIFYVLACLSFLCCLLREPGLRAAAVVGPAEPVETQNRILGHTNKLDMT